MESTFAFALNGRAVVVDGESCHGTLLQYLRAHGHTGTKEGCAEGDCGACTVVLVDADGDGRRVYRAMNSCIALLPMVAGREVLTVEGIAEQGPHPVQAALAEHYGSQCGYCTPGFAMSMFEGYHRLGGTSGGSDDTNDTNDTNAGGIDGAAGLSEPARVADQLCGNLCRCTGYRPIREAMSAALRNKEAAVAAAPAVAAVAAVADRFRLALAGPAASVARLAYEAGGERFYRPTTLAEVLELKARWPEARLVMGATELGVEINKKAARFPTLISVEGVPALRRVEAAADGSHWIVGGAATLTELEEGLAGELPAIDKMLAVFASRQIRNRASLAANLATASPIGDMAPVLLALDASLVLRSIRGARQVALDAFFVAYRKTVLADDEIIEAVYIPRWRSAGGSARHLDSFKVSKRREMDIAAVAAGLCVEVDAAGVVRAARFGFGGVAATPTRAKRTEAALVGRPWSRASALAVLPILAAEFSPIDDARASAAYRRALITGLLEKFVDGAAGRSEAMDLPPTYSVPAAAMVSSNSRLGSVTGGVAVADTSRALLHESGRGHASGAAKYVDDQAASFPTLVLWPVCAPHAHARILSLDASAALAMPGVCAVLTARDIPGTNDVGALRRDETLLAAGEVMFHGHMVAVVVGASYEQCRAAAGRVDVRYEPLPALLTTEGAVRAGSFHTAPHTIARGDAQGAITGAPHRLEGALEIGGQEHFYLESQAAWAERGDDGDVTVVSSTQHPTEIQASVSHVLGLARNKVVVQSPRMGGGFGGKETQGNTWAALVALAAWKTGRRVRVQLDRDLDLALTGKRHPFSATYRVGFDERGMLLGLEAKLYSNGGWSLDLSESICDRALFHIDNAYYLPAVAVTGRVCKTNLVSNTAFRGFGGPQGMVVIEEVIDRVARHLGLPPDEVRARNLYRGEGASNTTHYGQPLEDNRIQAIWRDLRDGAELASRRAAIDLWNAGSRRIKRGIAITPVKFGISFTASFLNQAGALVLVFRDGSVQVNHGGTEMGQGLHTKILGVAMRELGLPAERIRMMKTQTDKVPNTSPTAASAGADLNGQAVRNACLTLRARLAPVAARLLAREGAPAPDPATLVFEGGHVRLEGGHVRLEAASRVPFERVAEAAWLSQVSLSATGFYQTPGLHYDRAEGRGKPFHYFAYGAAVSEVEVDGYTGMKNVRRVDILHDVGESLHPEIDRGQIEGGFVQGLGWLTGEELRWDAAGRLLTHSASTYQIPAFSDAPADLRVTLLPRAAQAGTVHGSKAVGEPPLMLALSVREALRDAVAAFGAPGGDVPLAVPATHEAILTAIRARELRGPSVLD